MLVILHLRGSFSEGLSIQNLRSQTRKCFEEEGERGRRKRERRRGQRGESG
jgi:hypothetical protein